MNTAVAKLERIYPRNESSLFFLQAAVTVAACVFCLGLLLDGLAHSRDVFLPERPFRTVPDETLADPALLKLEQDTSAARLLIGC